ncbi:MAG: hypothetical protein H6811_11105 [Phycisphaeraceae bacterium]|nr:hypothetical protein [Phycisphaeraceae bacterium]
MALALVGHGGVLPLSLGACVVGLTSAGLGVGSVSDAGANITHSLRHEVHRGPACQQRSEQGGGVSGPAAGSHGLGPVRGFLGDGPGEFGVSERPRESLDGGGSDGEWSEGLELA